MPTTTQSKPDRRQQTHQVIAKLQQERNALWALYCDFASLKPFSATKPVKKTLTTFSQLLIDYISLGHFGVYERVLNGKERRDNVQAIASRLYPKLEATTEIAIAFNDKYDSSEHLNSFNELEKDLSVLGETLATRIDLEDQFCNLILDSDRRLVAR
jgi:regulator of sigma D